MTLGELSSESGQCYIQENPGIFPRKMEEICAISADDDDDDDDDDAKLYLSRDTKSELGHTFSITGNVCSIAKMPTKGEKKKKKKMKATGLFENKTKSSSGCHFFPLKNYRIGSCRCPKYNFAGMAFKF